LEKEKEDAERSERIMMEKHNQIKVLYTDVFDNCKTETCCKFGMLASALMRRSCYYLDKFEHSVVQSVGVEITAETLMQPFPHHLARSPPTDDIGAVMFVWR